jgi:hypothetical protein
MSKKLLQEVYRFQKIANLIKEEQDLDLSNAPSFGVKYLFAQVDQEDKDGGNAFIVDRGGPIEEAFKKAYLLDYLNSNLDSDTDGWYEHNEEFFEEEIRPAIKVKGSILTAESTEFIYFFIRI